MIFRAIQPPLPVYEPDYIVANGEVIDSRLFEREFYKISAMDAEPSSRQKEEPFYADDYRVRPIPGQQFTNHMFHNIFTYFMQTFEKRNEKKGSFKFIIKGMFFRFWPMVLPL